MSRKKKTHRRKIKRHAGKTEKEWSDWGEEFGKQMEKVGETFSRRMERHGRRIEKRYKDWWFDAFGIVGPLIGSIFGIFFLMVAIWFLNLIDPYLQNIFISMLYTFLYTNIQWFFLASLFFGYCNYLSKKYEEKWWLVSPIVNSLNIVFIIWILSSLFIMVGVYTKVNIIANFSNFLYENLLGIFVLFALIGYVFDSFKRTFHY